MVNTELIKALLTKLKEDATKGCELKSSDYSNGKNTLNVDAAHDAILYCQENKHNDNTIFTDTRYTADKQNDNYPGTSRQRSECVSKLEENVCYIRDSFSGVALKGYNNYLDSAGTPKKTLWHKYHFGIPIKTEEKIESRGDITKNEDLLKKIQKHSTFLNYDKFIDSEYGLSGNDDIDFDNCILGLNFTWQAVLYYGYHQFLKNTKNCTSEEYKENAINIIACLRQINFVKLGVSVPKWKIGHTAGGMFDNFNVFNDSPDEGDKAWNSMEKMPITSQDDDGEYYFITSQSFVHSQISKLLQPNQAKPGFEARNEGDEDSSGIGEVDMGNGMEKLLTTYNAAPTNGAIDEPAKIMLWQFLKFQGDSSHLVFYSIIKIATPADNPISIKILTGERPLVKRAQLEGKTIMVKKFKVFAKHWSEACSSDGRYIEFVSDPEGQANTLLAKAVSLKQSEYYADWGDNLDSEINQVKGIVAWSGGDYKDKIKSLKEKMDVFGKYVIKKKIQTYIGGDFENDAEKFFKLMRPAKDGVLKPIRGAGGKQFDFGKDVDVVFSKLGFLADNYDTLNDGTNNLPDIIDRMNWIMVGRRHVVGWVDHLQYIVNSFKSHEEADEKDVNYKVLVLKPNSNIDLEIDIKGLTTFVSMNYYVMNDRSIFSSSSDSYQKVFFFAKILKFFIEQGKIQLPGKDGYFSGGGAQVGGRKWYGDDAFAEINNKYIGHYENGTLKNMVKYLAEICRKIVDLKQNNITDMDSIIQIHGNVLKPISNIDDRFVWQEIGSERSDVKGQTTESLQKKQDQIASFRYKKISLSDDSVPIPDRLKMKWDSKTKQLIWKSEQGEDIPLKSPTPICTIVNEFSLRIYNQVPKEGHDIKKAFQKSNVVENDKYLKTLEKNYESEISGVKFISVKKEGAHIKWAKVEDNNVGLDKEFVTYKQLLYEEALVRKFLDTVPSNISTNEELKTFIDENNKAHLANTSIEETLPVYDTKYPYTIWWLYSYIHRGAAYEDFIDLFNSQITKTNNNTKYYFKNEAKFMEWKEKILSHEYNASIRYKYDYFLGGVFQEYFSTDTDFNAKAKDAADAATTAAVAASAAAANTVNEFKIFTELEIKHLIVSIISLSGRFSDDNAILEDMEIVNLIQKELNKAGHLEDKVFDDNEKDVAKDLDIVIGKTLTLDEVLDVKYETALKEGRVIDLTGDGPGEVVGVDDEVLKPQKTVQLSGDGETKKDIKATLKGIIDRVFNNTSITNDLNIDNLFKQTP